MLRGAVQLLLRFVLCVPVRRLQLRKLIVPPPLSVATKELRKAGEGPPENLYESEAAMSVWLWFAAGFICAVLYVHRRSQ